MQEEILQNYSVLVKTGGKLVYATCSILPSENELQVKNFIDKNPEFSVEEEKIILPSSGFDGFYMCRMKKAAK
jgi:16S rRNA (cytosine967-C5)-methyltransferase